MADRKPLVIVESPAKAKTIARFLGDSYMVESSIGHIRDLPRNAADVPDELKKEPWARLGVDVDHGFKPLYVIDADKKAHIARLRALVKQASELYLATDEDREGESIAWHLLEVLAPKVPVKRMVFHEITKRAIEHALQSPREVDRRLVDAQETRRILDRLYGYEVSPVLWKKVMPKLSAGRVQSVATRIVVQREQERIRFRSATYFDVDAMFEVPGKQPPELRATLVTVDGRRIATGRDFGEDGALKGEGKEPVVVLGAVPAEALAKRLESSAFTVGRVERKPYRRSPAAPFMTSTLQQEAARKLRFSAQRTMRAAQRLYENGYITYMRTDSTTLSETAVRAAREEIQRRYGADQLPDAPRAYANKVKNAQEAHEAIRPAGDSFRSPEDVSREVGDDESRLYELVWMRTIACQMLDARGETVVVRIDAKLDAKVRSEHAPWERAEFSVSGTTILFPGFLRAYVEGSDDPTAELEGKERQLPLLTEGESLGGRSFEPRGHETQPPARYTEASLVKRLEELGVGRPSTYASIIGTILDRGYVWKKGTALVPSYTAFAVIRLLEQHFGALVDYAFTARMEDDLDSIASGTEEPGPYLQRFYFGVPNQKDEGLALRTLVSSRLSEIDARAINSLPLGVDTEGRELVVRVGRYGAYLQRGEDTAPLPEELAPDELTVEKASELLSQPNGDRIVGTDPETGLPVAVKKGRFGNYFQVGEGGGKEKPRTASLLSTMSLESATLEDALKVLALPRVVGEVDGVPVTAQIGRFGPYVQKGSESRSLDSEDAVFTVDLPRALELLAQPRTRGRRGQPAAAPLRELGNDPVSGKPIVLREGRFGPYVTDGETNASLRKDDDATELTPGRAHELLAARRESGGSKKKAPRKKASAKKAPEASAAKPAAAKKASTKKAPAKKAPAKKAATKKAPAKQAAGNQADVDSEAPAAAAEPAVAKAPVRRKAPK